MVLKPLRIVADGLCSLAGLHVFVFHYAFPPCLMTERIAIDLNETVYEINASFKLFQAFYGVSIKGWQVSCGVIINKKGYEMLLTLVFRI